MDNKVKKILRKAKADPVFFAENFLFNQKMQKYKLEPQQKLFLRDKSPYKILFCSRRSGKTLSMIVDILHNAFFKRNQSIILLAPTGDQAKVFSFYYVFSTGAGFRKMRQGFYLIGT